MKIQEKKTGEFLEQKHMHYQVYSCSKTLEKSDQKNQQNFKWNSQHFN